MCLTTLFSIDWNDMQNVKMDLASTDTSFDPNTTSVLSPCFLAEIDINAGAGGANTLYWDTNGWFNGHYAQGPNADDQVSSFDVFDSLVDYYFNETMYPKMEVSFFLSVTENF